MTADFRSRTQYLSLALFSQRVVRTLFEYLKSNDAASLHESLRDALVALEKVISGEVPSSIQGRAALFSSYEHLRTLEEVWNQEEQLRVVEMIRQLLGDSIDRQQPRENARSLIDLFLRLGNQARWNFEQPGSPSPRAIRELCQAH